MRIGAILTRGTYRERRLNPSRRISGALTVRFDSNRTLSKSDFRPVAPELTLLLETGWADDVSEHRRYRHINSPIGPAVSTESRNLIWTLLLFQLAALIGREFARVRILAAGTGPFTAECLSYLVVPPILLILSYPIIHKHKNYLRKILSWEHIGCRDILHALIVSVAIWVMVLAWTIASSAFEVVRYNTEVIHALPRYSFSIPSVPETVLGLLVFSAIVPIVEEVINRGIILKILLRNGQTTALVVSSIFFAVFHDPDSIMSALVIGLFLGMLYIRTNDLWMPIIVHAIYNACTVLDRLWIEGTWTGMDGDPKVCFVGAGGLGVFVASICFVFLVTRPEDVSEAQPTPR